MKIFELIRQLRHPLAVVFGLVAFLVGVLGLSVPGWRAWLSTHGLAGWIVVVALTAILVFGFTLLEQHVVEVETAHGRTRTKLAEAKTRERSAVEALQALKAEPSPSDHRLFAEWQDEYPDNGDWRYHLRFFNPKRYTSELTVPMYALAHGHWSDRHFTDSEVERAFRGVVVAAWNFEEGIGAVSQHEKTRDDVVYYAITDFSDSAGGETRYRAEITRSMELAEAVTVAIRSFEQAARDHRL